jgi:hypothetical protein
LIGRETDSGISVRFEIDTTFFCYVCIIIDENGVLWHRDGARLQKGSGRVCPGICRILTSKGGNGNKAWTTIMSKEKVLFLNVIR